MKGSSSLQKWTHLNNKFRKKTATMTPHLGRGECLPKLYPNPPQWTPRLHVSSWLLYLCRSARLGSASARVIAEEVTDEVDDDDEDDQREKTGEDCEGEIAAVVRRVVWIVTYNPQQTPCLSYDNIHRFIHSFASDHNGPQKNRKTNKRKWSEIQGPDDRLAEIKTLNPNLWPNDIHICTSAL